MISKAAAFSELYLCLTVILLSLDPCSSCAGKNEKRVVIDNTVKIDCRTCSWCAEKCFNWIPDNERVVGQENPTCTGKETCGPNSQLCQTLYKKYKAIGSAPSLTKGCTTLTLEQYPSVTMLMLNDEVCRRVPDGVDGGLAYEGYLCVCMSGTKGMCNSMLYPNFTDNFFKVVVGEAVNDINKNKWFGITPEVLTKGLTGATSQPDASGLNSSGKVLPDPDSARSGNATKSVATLTWKGSNVIATVLGSLIIVIWFRLE